jgi:hypothetical protein
MKKTLKAPKVEARKKLTIRTRIRAGYAYRGRGASYE